MHQFTQSWICYLLILVTVMMLQTTIVYARENNNWLGLSFRLIISEGGIFPVSVASVIPGSLADQAGLRPGDLIYRINNVAVGPGNFFTVLNSYPPGQLATFHVLRENKIWPVQVVLPDRTGRIRPEIQPKSQPLNSEPLKLHTESRTSSADHGIVPVEIIRRVEPVYPEEIRKLGLKGKVDVEMYIDETGRMSGLKVINSPHQVMSEAALTAVKQWQFSPAKKKGVPYATKLRITILFRKK